MIKNDVELFTVFSFRLMFPVEQSGFLSLTLAPCGLPVKWTLTKRPLPKRSATKETLSREGLLELDASNDSKEEPDIEDNQEVSSVEEHTDDISRKLTSGVGSLESMADRFENSHQSTKKSEVKAKYDEKMERNGKMDEIKSGEIITIGHEYTSSSEYKDHSMDYEIDNKLLKNTFPKLLPIDKFEILPNQSNILSMKNLAYDIHRSDFFDNVANRDSYFQTQKRQKRSVIMSHNGELTLPLEKTIYATDIEEYYGEKLPSKSNAPKGSRVAIFPSSCVNAMPHEEETVFDGPINDDLVYELYEKHSFERPNLNSCLNEKVQYYNSSGRVETQFANNCYDSWHYDMKRVFFKPIRNGYRIPYHYILPSSSFKNHYLPNQKLHISKRDVGLFVEDSIMNSDFSANKNELLIPYAGADQNKLLAKFTNVPSTLITIKTTAYINMTSKSENRSNSSESEKHIENENFFKHFSERTNLGVRMKTNSSAPKSMLLDRMNSTRRIISSVSPEPREKLPRQDILANSSRVITSTTIWGHLSQYDLLDSGFGDKVWIFQRKNATPGVYVITVSHK